MIVKNTNGKPPISGYEKYFLFEAPDDEPPKKKNVKVIKLRPYDKRRTDYTKMVPQIGDEPDDSDGDTSANDVSTDSETSDAATEDTPSNTSDDNQSTEPNDDSTDNSVDDDTTGTDTMTDDTEYSTDGDESLDDASADTTGDDSGDDSESSDDSGDNVTDDTDYSSDDAESSDDDGSDTTDDTDYSADDNGDDASDDTTNDTNDQKKDDKSNKFVLFKKFITLEGAVANYIQKLSSIISDDVECNHIYKKITNNLKELDEMIHEYMVIKFENSSYVESMLFYQRILASININFDMLKGIRDKEIKMSDRKIKH